MYIIQVALHNASRTTHLQSTELCTPVIWNMCIIQLALYCATKRVCLQTKGLCTALLKGNMCIIQLALHWVSTTIHLQSGWMCTALFKWHVYNPLGWCLYIIQSDYLSPFWMLTHCHTSLPKAKMLLAAPR